MRKTCLLSLVSCLCASMSHAAGTYYTGGYRSPQQNYARPGYANVQATTTAQPATYSTVGYSRYGNQQVVGQTVTRQQVSASATGQSQGSGQGFFLNAGINRESAMWQFDMKDAGSSLHYDNVTWNVFDATAGYKFGGNTPIEVRGGIVYGMQGGDSTMVDDDITKGGYFITQWVDTSDNVIGNQIGHALSIGTTSGGSMFGYNAQFGLTDFFKIGNLKITPAIGWRSLSYKLETKANYGLSVDTAKCFLIDGEEQCDPAIVINFADGKQQILWRDKTSDSMAIGSGATTVDPGGTYSYRQPGISHAYNVEWSGPYLAMDMRYDINANNYVNGRVEFGMPGYKATGDQPYRFDWAHPTSVEDSAGMMSAMHLGMGADWNTAITDNVSLSIGLTYNYYSVSGANAKTYLNGTYYNAVYTEAQAIIDNAASSQAAKDSATGIQANINNLQAQCPGWVCSADGEVDSFYKSMGVRVGLAAKF